VVGRRRSGGGEAKQESAPQKHENPFHSMEQQPFAQPTGGSRRVDEKSRISLYNLGLKLREDTPSGRDCFACAPSPAADDEEVLI